PLAAIFDRCCKLRKTDSLPRKRDEARHWPAEIPCVQLLECVARAPNNSFCYWKPVPKAGTFIAFELLPHSRCISRGQMFFAETAMHCGIKFRPAMKCTTPSETFLDQLQHLGGPSFPEITL